MSALKYVLVIHIIIDNTDYLYQYVINNNQLNQKYLLLVYFKLMKFHLSTIPKIFRLKLIE